MPDACHYCTTKCLNLLSWTNFPQIYTQALSFLSLAMLWFCWPIMIAGGACDLTTISSKTLERWTQKTKAESFCIGFCEMTGTFEYNPWKLCQNAVVQYDFCEWECIFLEESTHILADMGKSNWDTYLVHAFDCILSSVWNIRTYLEIY